MVCQNCKSGRIAFISAKCSDMCSVTIGQEHTDGYVPNRLGIGGGDFLKFKYCLECGQLQGKFPLALYDLEKIHHCLSDYCLECDDYKV